MSAAIRGNAAEAQVLNALVNRGFEVAVPFGDGHPYDLLVDLTSTFLRVQCKRAWVTSGCITFNARTTDHGRGRESYSGRAEAFGVFSPLTEAVYFVPVADITTFKG